MVVVVVVVVAVVVVVVVAVVVVVVVAVVVVAVVVVTPRHESMPFRSAVQQCARLLRDQAITVACLSYPAVKQLKVVVVVVLLVTTCRSSVRLVRGLRVRRRVGARLRVAAVYYCTPTAVKAGQRHTHVILDVLLVVDVVVDTLLLVVVTVVTVVVVVVVVVVVTVVVVCVVVVAGHFPSPGLQSTMSDCFGHCFAFGPTN